MIGARVAWAVLFLVVACGGSGAKSSEEPADTHVAAQKGELRADASDGSDDSENSDNEAPKTVNSDSGDGARALVTDTDFPVVFGVFQSMSRAVIDHAGDCDGMAVALRKVVVSHKILLARLRAVKQDGALNQRFMTAYGVQIQQIMTQMAPIAQACGSHPGVKKVFEDSL